MRRVFLIVMMFLLPLQWTWATAATVCAHETDSTVSHFGHHQHEHRSAQAGDDTQGGGDTLAYHPDCGTCHSVATAHVQAGEPLPGPWDVSSVFASYEATVPDRALETLLRPPLTLVS